MDLSCINSIFYFIFIFFSKILDQYCNNYLNLFVKSAVFIIAKDLLKKAHLYQTFLIVNLLHFDLK